MNTSVVFARLLFFFLSIVFMLAYTLSKTAIITPRAFAWGIGLGGAMGASLIGIGLLFKRFHLRSFNVSLVGLFIGYLMSLALIATLNAVLTLVPVPLHSEAIGIIKIAMILFGTYLGVVMTIRASDEIYLSIPFVKFAPMQQKSKEILLDYSALNDPRVIDLAASGLLDKRLILPRFFLNELYEQEENQDELLRSKARRALDVVKKLESLKDLQLRYNDTDFPEVKDLTEKILRLGRLLDADILATDINRIQQSTLEGIRIINLHALSNALKPLMQKGEYLKLKIQRFGKEERQGVGYLEDGTMVVVNGGGDFIGEQIKARVLSVKHTASGRMIFCNVAEEELEDNLSLAP